MMRRKCGTEAENVKESYTEDVENAAGKKKGGKGLPAKVLVAAMSIIVALVAGIIFFQAFLGRTLAEGNLDADGRADSQAAQEETNISQEGEVPLYSILDVNTIDIYAINRIPAEKAFGMTWDASLFYWLEDVNPKSTEDGYLAKCRISKTLLRNSESGELIQYEVYRDPGTAEIYKIVSIEEKDGSLLLTDYYYQHGVPNFIFVRQDSVYTPTYATTDKTGDRYYFEGDVMVRWRMIQTPREIEEYVLSPSAVSYRQYDYFQEKESARKMYDDVEIRMLNAAYNTYQAIESQTGIGLMEGMVKDTAGAGIGGVMVDIRRTTDNVLLYRTVTREDGIFRCFVYLDGSECFLSVRENDTFKDAAMYGIFLADSGITGMYGTLVLHKSAGGEYPVHINIYMAEDVRSGENGSMERTPAYDATVSLRKGMGAREGEVFQTLQAGEGGVLDTALPSGTYTAQIDVPGCARTFLEIRVDEEETSVDSYVLPELAEGVTGVVLTWEDRDVDLDLTLFTPFQATAGDMAHIGGGILADENGNYLVSDNSAGCEVIYVNTAQEGSYKVYVSDYTNSQSEYYNADMLGSIHIHIYIYDNNGLAAEYTFPVGQVGVIWEVAEISGSQITPSQRVYQDMEGKNWWLEKKQKKRLVRVNWKYEDGRSWASSWEEYSYDALGNQTKHLFYNRDGLVTQWEEYHYDNKGNRIKETGYCGDGSVDWEKHYDSQGNEIKYESFDPENNFMRETSFDSQGKEIKCTYWYYNGMETVVDYWTEKCYDSQGREIKSVCYGGWLTDGSVNSWTEMSYDSQGNMIKSVEYDGDGLMRSWTGMSYDSQGNMIKRVEYDSDGLVRFWTEISYDGRGNETGHFGYLADGSVLEGYEYTYDDRGNRIRSARYNWLGLSNWSEYSYDSQGNLIEQVYYNGDCSREWSAEYLYEQ